MGAKPIKVCLTYGGAATGTPWAEDLGPAPGPSGSRRVRLLNVPFLHAKPTWGDVIVVSPVVRGLPTWDRRGVPWAKLPARIAEDGGRWAMIVDYVPHEDTAPAAACRALEAACADEGVICEPAWLARPGHPGRVYFAIEHARSDAEVLAALRAAELPCELVQIHPAPAATKRRAPAKAKARPVAKPKPRRAARRR